MPIYNVDEYYGAYTPADRAAGIGAIMYGSWGGDDDTPEPNDDTKLDEIKLKLKQINEVIRKQRSDIVKVIANLKTVEQVQNKVLKKLLADNLDRIALSYKLSEHLPSAYFELAKQTRALPILIKGAIKDFINSPLSKDVLERIEEFCSGIYLNEDLDTPYDRVSKVQKFAHQTVDSALGYGAHKNLPSDKMKHLLSAARLHLSIEDFRYCGPDVLYDIIKRSKQDHDKEKNEPRPVTLQPSKIYVKGWRLKHLKSILRFQDDYQKNQVFAVLNIDKQVDLETFKKAMLSIFEPI